MSSAIPVVMATAVQAAGFYWDGTSTGPDADGGDGVWSLASDPENWMDAATGGTSYPWRNGSVALFGGASGVVTVSGLVNSDGLIFTTTGYRLTGGQIEIDDAAPNIDVGAHDATVETIISGSMPALQKTGTGTLTLSGANTFGANLTIYGGTVKAGNAKAFGSTAGVTVVRSGATVELDGKGLGKERMTIVGAGVGGAGAIVNNGAPSTSALESLTLSGAATVGGSARWDVRGTAGSLTMGGFTLTKVGTNEFRLVSSNLVTPGNVDVKEGSFWVETTHLGSTSARSVTVRSGAALGLANNQAYSAPWSAIFEANSSWKTTNACIWNGPVSLGGATTFHTDTDAAMILNGVASGAGSITKTGSGVWTLNAVNTFTGGTTVNGGTLTLNGASSTTTGAGTVRGQVSVNEGGTLRLTKANALGTAAAFRVSPLNVTSGLVENAVSSSNTAGVINLRGGTLRSSGGNANPTGTNCFTMTNDTVVNGLAAPMPSVISGRLHLGTGNAGNSSVFDVADGDAVEDLQIDAAVTGAGAANGIAKRGAGVLSLRGPALFTGPTMVEAGSLFLDGSGSLEDSVVTVQPGARFGTFLAGQSLASLTAAAGSSLVLPAVTTGATVVEGALHLAGGTISICPVLGADLAPGTYDLLEAGSITGAGTPVLDVSGVFGSSHVTGSVVVNGNKLQLILTGAGDALVWNNASAAGAADGAWNMTLENFSDGTGNAAFRAFDAVTFDDSVAPGSAKTIGLSTSLAPSQMTVANSNGDYTFNSAGRVAGAGSLVKTGTGRLTFAGAQSYAMTGPITAGGGVLDFTGKTIAAAGLTLAGGTLDNATVSVGPMDLQAGSSNATLKGSAPWSKTTAGAVTLTANNNLTGPGTIGAGQLIVGNVATPNTSGALGTGAVAIANGASLTFARGGSSADVTIQNSLSGAGSVVVAGSNIPSSSYSTIFLNGDNRFLTGPVTLSNATVRVSSDSGAGSGPISLTGSTTLGVFNATLPNAITVASNTPKVTLSNGKLTGPITLTGGTTTEFSNAYVTANNVVSGAIGETGGAASLRVANLSSSGSTLTLAGANTYTGTTSVGSSTRLNLTGSLGASAVTVIGFGSIGGNGVIGAGGSLTFGYQAGLRVATSGGALTVNGDVNFGTATNLLVDVTQTPVNGPVPVLQYTGTLTGGAGQLVISDPTVYRKTDLVFAPGLITLDIGRKALVWKGTDGTPWEIGGSTMRWGTSNGGAATDYFFQGDSVEFNDSGSGGYVSTSTNVARPSSVVVNSTKNYTIGTRIDGACSLVKSGTGSLRLLGFSGYTGGTTVNAGTLELEGDYAVGTGPVTVAASATLSGVGSFTGPATISGAIDPGRSSESWAGQLGIGPAVFSGNYLCKIYSIYSATYSDRLVVAGDLNLAGATLTIVPEYPNMLTPPPTWIVASYTGTLTGSFSTVNGIPDGYVLKYLSDTKQIVVTRKNYSEWTAGLSDATNNGDPDGDGISNLLEFLLNGNPGAPSNGILPTPTLNANSLIYRFKRSASGRLFTSQVVQWSTDMASWTDIPIPLSSSGVVDVDADGTGADDVTVTIPRLPGSMYVRLKVTQL